MQLMFFNTSKEDFCKAMLIGIGQEFGRNYSALRPDPINLQ
jgi:hypothetical protein